MQLSFVVWGIVSQHVMLSLLLSALRFTITHAATEGLMRTMEVCHSEHLRIKCSWNEVIVISTAVYGRMRISRCVHENFGYVGCSADVTYVMDANCSGRRACHVRILDDTFSMTEPCHDDLNSYLEVQYQCVSVFIPEALDCAPMKPFPFPADSNFLYFASTLFPSVGCTGSAEVTWSVSAFPGQRIRISLLDFSVTTALDNNSSVHSTVEEPFPMEWDCRVQYGVVSDPVGGGGNRSVCGGQGPRERLIYETQSNLIDIRLTRPRTIRPRRSTFLLKLQVVGCQDLDAPSGGWIIRDASKAICGCNNSSQTWRLDCFDNNWRGNRGNCTSPSSAIVSPASLDEGFPSSMGILFLVALGSGTVVCVLSVFIFNRILRPKRERQDSRRLRDNTLSIY